MKKIKIFSLFVCLAMLVIACHNDDDERGVQMRTVLVYIAGDNSLRSFATEDLAEMTEGMQSVDDNSYNLLVYIDTGSSPSYVAITSCTTFFFLSFFNRISLGLDPVSMYTSML